MTWGSCRDSLAYFSAVEKIISKSALQLFRRFVMTGVVDEKILGSGRLLATFCFLVHSLGPLHLRICPMPCSLGTRPLGNSRSGVWSFSDNEHQIAAVVLLVVAKGSQHCPVKWTARWVKWWLLHPRNEPSKSVLQSSDGWVSGNHSCTINPGMILDQYVKKNNFQGWKAAPFPGDHVFSLLWMKDLGKLPVISPYHAFQRNSVQGQTYPGYRTTWLLLLLK